MVLERYRINNKGFTLVELMTVVAIIGALAALGVPQYKKMQRKAKRAESSMVLGVIASAEAAFYAEYNGYGNSMGGIGAEMDNDPQYYHAGFFSANSAITPVTSVAFWEYGKTTSAANPNQFPGYSSSTIRAPFCDGNGSAVVRSIIGACVTRAGASAAETVPSAKSNCSVASSIGYATTGDTNRPIFTAVAKGNLYQSSAAPVQDCVTIDHMREVRVQTDGS